MIVDLVTSSKIAAVITEGSFDEDFVHKQFVYSGATLGWTGTQIHFFQLLNHKRFHKLALVSFLHLQKISIFAKFGGCGTKTKLATPISIFNFSRAWQSYFLS